MVRSGRWLVALVVLGGLAAIGCGPGETGSSGSSGTGGGTTTTASCPADPADGSIPEECGIWVSASQGDDKNAGTQAAPVASLAHAIELADAAERRVYACVETWQEALKVPSGVSIYGGFDCAAGWKYVGETTKSKLLSPSPIAITWLDTGHQEQASMTDFHVESSDAVEPGASSIAALKNNALPLFLTRCDLIAGNGANGADGKPGDPNDEPASPGNPGAAGAAACSGVTSKGGSAPETICANGTSLGGAGGDSGPMVAASGQSGTPVADPPSGAGGLGEQVAPQCTAGNPGQNGAPGAYGFGGGHGNELPDGELSDAGWSGPPGQDGADGVQGQGGGGGGATFGSAAICGAAKPSGAAGGSGGSGGCGGRGGRGGRGGGGSFALMTVVAGETTATACFLKSGRGGNGGNGGPPQKGGAGAAPGLGGAGSSTIKVGCAGGQGGDGGKGGWGGGGSGGESAPFLVRNGSSRIFKPQCDWMVGEGGDGGSGDPDHAFTSTGVPGTAAIELSVVPF